MWAHYILAVFSFNSQVIFLRLSELSNSSIWRSEVTRLLIQQTSRPSLYFQEFAHWRDTHTLIVLSTKRECFRSTGLRRNVSSRLHSTATVRCYSGAVVDLGALVQVQLYAHFQKVNCSPVWEICYSSLFYHGRRAMVIRPLRTEVSLCFK